MPAVPGAGWEGVGGGGEPRWMSGVRVKMCFCPLFSADFHSALSRAHSPGRGAPLLPPRAGGSCGKCTWA